MRIVNINFTKQGGAGTAAYRTHTRLRELGYESLLFLAEEELVEENIFAMREKEATPKPPSEDSFLDKVIRKVKWQSNKLIRLVKPEQEYPFKAYEEWKYCFFSISELEKISIKKVLKEIKDGDIVILYWIGQGLMNTANMVQLKKKANIQLYWYALDMAPVTGGCHYFWDCKGYQLACNNCPVPKDGHKDFAHLQHQHKQKNLQKIDITLLASSDIGVDAFEKASIRFNRYFKLPYAINTDIFKIANQDSRNVNQPFKVFFNAQNIADIRKGWEYFKSMIIELDKQLQSRNIDFDVQLISVNAVKHQEELGILKKVKIFDVNGVKNTEETLAGLYQMTDLFICTSVEDLSPLMVNEAMLCGVPVIGFNNASNNEYIIDNENGILIESYDVKQMAIKTSMAIAGEIAFKPKEFIRNSIIQLHRKEDWKKSFEQIINN
jgi:glycosyltransferase involved in cell wall biosynthesis